jgi:prevent-host-death family protein
VTGIRGSSNAKARRLLEEHGTRDWRPAASAPVANSAQFQLELADSGPPTSCSPWSGSARHKATTGIDATSTWTRSGGLGGRRVTTSCYTCSHFMEAHLDTVGIRELKTHLSRHLKRVRAGTRLLVTEHGRSIATINPVETPADIDWAHQLVAEGGAHWNGGKPAGARKPVALTGKRTAASVVLEDRR